MSNYILDKAYAIENETGCGAYLAVVSSGTAGGCKLPDGANEQCIGITIHSNPDCGGGVAVRKAGIARVKAAGPVAVGAPVMIADERGYVRESGGDFGKINCIGFAETGCDHESGPGEWIEVFLQFHQRVI